MTTVKEENDAQILIEFTPKPGLKQVSLKPVELAKKSAEAVDGAMSTINHMAQRLNKTISEITRPPSEVEIAFGLKFDAEWGAIIAKTGLEASINVKLQWKHTDNE